MKKYIRSGKLILIIPVLLIAMLLGSLIYALNTSSNIRMYKSTLCSLASGPYEITAEYDGTTVRLRQDNQNRLLNFVASANYYAKGWKKPSGDVIHYFFEGEDTKWTVDIYEIDDEKVLFDVQGDKNFSFTIDNKGKFKKFVRLGTPDGWDKKNIIISKKD